MTDDNSPDQFTDITTNSWGSNIAGSITGMILGLMLFIAAFPLLWWNEGRSVERIKTLDEGRALVMAVPADAISGANNGKLVYISGKADTDEVLKDALFGVQENAIKLKRKVEMYQWKETKSETTHKNVGGSSTTETHYSYEKTWSEELINSSSFRHSDAHNNPSGMPYRSETFTAGNVHVGAFRLSDAFTGKLNKFSEYPLSEQNLAAMEKRLQPYFKLNGNQYFYGDPANPQVGALRVGYSIIKPGDASVVGKQDNAIIAPYFTRHGDIKLIEMGTVSPDSMFADAENENLLIAWAIRLGGFLLMAFGVALLLGPLGAIASVVPVIGYIVEGGAGAISFLIALVLSLVTVSLAWIFYRPLTGIILLVLAVSAFVGGKGLIARIKAAKINASISQGVK